MTKSKATVWLSLFFIMATSSSLAEVAGPPDIQKSCREFVQRFYDWYVPKALEESQVPSVDLALKYKRSAFSTELFQALNEDSAAQGKVAAEIVGLDFDPFLNSQEPRERYVVGNVTSKNDRYWVEVFSVSSGNKSAKPAVIPELTHKDGQWIFVNFHYRDGHDSEDADLLSILKNLRQLRQGIRK